MRRSPFLRPRAVASAVALCLVAAVATLGHADVNVHGVRPGTQHSPTVAMTPTATYVLSYDMVDTASEADYLRIAKSVDGALTFQNTALPALPADWVWRPNGAIAYDRGSELVWMVGQARSNLGAASQIGVYVAAGSPLPGGDIDWFTPRALWTLTGTSVILPRLALATGDGSDNAFVLFQNAYQSSPGEMTLYRVPTDYGTGGTVFRENLAAIESNVTYSLPTLAVGPGGDVMASWLKVPTTGPQFPAPLVLRTSHDGGGTFGSEETVASMDFVFNGPGSVLGTVQLPTLLFARYAQDFPQTRLVFWGSPYKPFPNVVDPSDIFFVTDCCSGGPWNEFGSPHDRGFGSFELNPAVTMAEDSYFYMGWHDFAPFDPDSVSRFMVSRVWNMGASASPPVPLAAATFDWDNVVSNLAGMGWMSGVATLADRVTFAWGDHRGADPDVYARSFRAGGYAMTQCAGDTVNVVAGQHAEFAWRIENHNELFEDEYAYAATGTRYWANGFELDTVIVAPDGYADVTFGFDVPDTAAAGLMQTFAYTRDHVRESSCPMYLRIQSLVGVEPDGGPVAGAVALSAARPNPSPGAMAFTFSLPAAVDVDLAVYDLRGRRVTTLVRGAFEPGAHAARWDGTRAAPGIYFARLTVRAGGGAVTTREQRVVILR